MSVIDNMNSQEIDELINCRQNITSSTQCTGNCADCICNNNDDYTQKQKQKQNDSRDESNSVANEEEYVNESGEEYYSEDENENENEDEEEEEEEEEEYNNKCSRYNNCKKINLHYYEMDEIREEKQMELYHKRKNFGNWQYAKMIVSHSNDDKQATEFFCDYLDNQFIANTDHFDNINKVYYKNNLDIGIIYEFESEIAKYFIDNLKIPAFKPKGYIFTGDENQNKWSFKIVVITTKGIYTANRYINENIIGFH
jgi:hypothetical protein